RAVPAEGGERLHGLPRPAPHQRPGGHRADAGTTEEDQGLLQEAPDRVADRGTGAARGQGEKSVAGSPRVDARGSGGFTLFPTHGELIMAKTAVTKTKTATVTPAPKDGSGDILRRPAEVEYAAELQALATADKDARPEG